jgi:hypothetical protein
MKAECKLRRVRGIAANTALADPPAVNRWSTCTCQEITGGCEAPHARPPSSSQALTPAIGHEVSDRNNHPDQRVRQHFQLGKDLSHNERFVRALFTTFLITCHATG